LGRLALRRDGAQLRQSAGLPRPCRAPQASEPLLREWSKPELPAPWSERPPPAAGIRVAARVVGPISGPGLIPAKGWSWPPAGRRPFWWPTAAKLGVRRIDPAEGAAWYGDVPNRRCVRVREGGQEAETIDLDVGCFACMFGGPDRKTLFMAVREWRAGEHVRRETHGPGAVHRAVDQRRRIALAELGDNPGNLLSVPGPGSRKASCGPAGA
jgi:hypothetical protein